MTVAVIIAGLLPIMWGSGTGSEVMRRIAAPMVGGMITAPLLSMFVIPAAYLLPVKSMKWPAMTMTFKVKDKAMLDKLGAGKKVEVEFEQRGKDYVITSVK